MFHFSSKENASVSFFSNLLQIWFEHITKNEFDLSLQSLSPIKRKIENNQKTRKEISGTPPKAKEVNKTKRKENETQIEAKKTTSEIKETPTKIKELNEVIKKLKELPIKTEKTKNKIKSEIGEIKETKKTTCEIKETLKPANKIAREKTAEKEDKIKSNQNNV